ncbi:MAG: hypothetical protein GVY29_06815, partial [Spirochaetes bacterium]|nr:hypothetical protein [Spirochaetota bacterium]
MEIASQQNDAAEGARAPRAEDRLRAILTGNAAFSGVSGVVALTMTRRVAAFLGIEAHALLFIVALGLVGFATLLVILRTRRVIRQTLIRVVSAADTVWVVATVVLLFGFPEVLSAAGSAVVTAIAVVVAGFAAAQMHALSWM